MARDFSGTLVSKLFEPEPVLKCVDRGFCCDWISKGGRCQRTMAPHYASLVKGKIGCSAFEERHAPQPMPIASVS